MGVFLVPGKVLIQLTPQQSCSCEEKEIAKPVQPKADAPFVRKIDEGKSEDKSIDEKAKEQALKAEFFHDCLYQSAFAGRDHSDV